MAVSRLCKKVLGANPIKELLINTGRRGGSTVGPQSHNLLFYSGLDIEKVKNQ